jgi:hypothetical protein
MSLNIKESTKRIGNHIMKYVLAILNLLAGLVLTRFTISKLAAWPISVAAFEDMAKPIGIDPTFFRITTGFIIGYAAISFFVNFFLIIRNKLGQRSFTRLFVFNCFYALGAMTGALFSEFFLRSNPKWVLVYIAVGIIAIVISNLVTFYGAISNVLLSPKKSQAL